MLGIKAKFHRELLAALTDEEQAILLVLLRKVGGMKVSNQPDDAPAMQRASAHDATAEAPSNAVRPSRVARAPDHSLLMPGLNHAH